MSRLQAAPKAMIGGLRAIPFEAFFWMVALVVVASMDPEAPARINLCLFENLGIPCPGDGLGHGIAYLARGKWAASWNAHPLAVPVVAGLLYHVVSLVRTAGAVAGEPSCSSPSRLGSHV